MIKSQDLLIVTAIAASKNELTQKNLGDLLFISQSHISEGIKRCERVNLINSAERKVNVANLLELISYGLKYFFPVEYGGLVRGVPTAWGTLPLSEILLVPDAQQPIPVWAHAEGQERGLAVLPLHKNVPFISLQNPELHKVYALIDAIRMGKVREKELAKKHLEIIFRKKDHEA